MVEIIRNITLPANAARAALFWLALALPAYAGSEIFTPCAQQHSGDDAERLKCYDQLADPVSGDNAVPDKQPAASAIPAVAATRSAERSYLTRAWNLDDLSNLDPSKLGRLQPYRQNYLLVKKTSNPNRQPGTPSIGHTAVSPNDVDTVETKFLLSLKADIGHWRNINFLGIKTFRVWGAYTQQSHWQVLNFRNSSPFRETIYEPELIASLDTGHASGLKIINLGWVHQSNGRLLPESRSWNRVYLQGGWEWNNTTSILLRGWRRLPENALEDDNPDISDYLGRGDLVVRWEPGDKSQSVAMLLRNNLRGTANRGFVQIDWATPVRLGDAARMHIQLTSGYGESLIDYNHRQNTLGLGFSFREW